MSQSDTEQKLGNPMRKLKLTIAMTVLGMLAFAGNRLSAFPLTLTSVRGVISTTHHYGTTAVTTTDPAVKFAVTLPRLLLVLSNDYFIDQGQVAPRDMRVVLDPFTEALYLTNHSGFFYDLVGPGFGSFRIRNVATTFNTNTQVEQDTAEVDLNFSGTLPGGGGSFVFDLRNSAVVKFTVTSGVGTMTISGKGLGYGEINSSDSGVSVGAIKAAGSGTPEWSGPYSVYWANNLF
jgi:hypothetical protein